MILPLNPLEFRHRAVSLYGEKIGVVDGELRFSYQQYDQQVNRLANVFSEIGVGKGDVVSILTYNSHQLLESYYAVPQIGAILNPINIRLSASEIKYILNHAGSRVLCFHRDFKATVDSIRAKLASVNDFVVMESKDDIDWALQLESLMADASPDAIIDLADVDENAVIELFYTSGTTGQLKGVAITNRSLYIHTLAAIPGFQVTDKDTLLHVVPLFHVNGWGTPQFLTAVGGKHVMLRKIDPGEILRLIDVEKVTKMLGVPTIFNALLQHPDLKNHDLSSLQEVFIGGAPSSSSLIEAIEDNIGCRAYVGYGLTETSPVLTIARPKHHLESDIKVRQGYQAKTGLPLVGVQIRVVDDRGDDVPQDEKTIGEIIVRGNQVMTGYHNNKEETAAAILDGWFYTGDMAVIDNEGYLTIVDRKKDIIISGGENISSVEVEKAIQNHPDVYEVVVIGIPDKKWGEVSKALVVLKPDTKVTEDELIEFSRGSLAGFKVPKSVEFRENLPKSGTGKISKKELRDPYWIGFEKKVN